jgi:hypothetical protein
VFSNPVLEKEKNQDKKQMMASCLDTNEKLAEGALSWYETATAAAVSRPQCHIRLR